MGDARSIEAVRGLRRSVVRGSSMRIAMDVHAGKLSGASREPQDKEPV
jgi:hypothetical protein